MCPGVGSRNSTPATIREGENRDNFETFGIACVPTAIPDGQADPKSKNLLNLFKDRKLDMSNKKSHCRPFVFCLVLLGLWLTGPVSADPAAIEARLQTLVGDSTELVINETPIDGIYEVRIRGEILYMSANGRYLMQGRMLDLETQVDLTDAAKAEVRQQALEELDRATWISFGNDDADHQILVFTDPDCGYCRRLHEQVDEYNANGITIHYLAFPRAGVGSGTYEKLVSVWCAEDQQDAMDIAKAGRTPRKAECDNPVNDQYLLGQTMGVTGTPALMTLNGDLIPGYVPPEQLRQRLDNLANGR